MTVVTLLIVWMSEILVGTVELAATALGLSSLFVGIVVVAVVGNAAEQSTAVLFAVRNRMEVAIDIAIGASHREFHSRLRAWSQLYSPRATDKGGSREMKRVFATKGSDLENARFGDCASLLSSIVPSRRHTVAPSPWQWHEGAWLAVIAAASMQAGLPMTEFLQRP